MTATMLIGAMLIVFIVLGFLVAVAALVGHPEIKPVKVDNTDLFERDVGRELGEICNAIPGPMNTSDYDEDYRTFDWYDD